MAAKSEARPGNLSWPSRQEWPSRSPRVIAPRDEVEGALGDLEPRRFVEHQARIGERRDHQSVPVGQHLVVEAGAHACRARVEKFCAQRREPRLVRIAARQRFEPIEDVVAFEIAGRRHVVVAGEELAILDAELL